MDCLGSSSNYIAVAIDFGTTFSGYAYCTKKDFESKAPIKINKPWKTGGMGVEFLKTPTTVLFEANGKFHSFGFEAEKKYATLALRKKQNSWYYFRRFKMSLHRSLRQGVPEKLSRTTELKDETGNKSMKAMKIFSSSIRYLKDHLLSALQEKGSVLAGQRDATDKIQWVLTVPAIWDEDAKQFMREAAEEAGIKGTQLLLALEPEAASFCCQLLQNENPDSDTSLLPIGTKYMILDLGGGTADITSHKILDKRSIKEFHAPTGGYWGGTKVNIAFEDVLISLIGAPIMQRFKTEYHADYLDMHTDFESIKQTVDYDKNDEVVIKIPHTLFQLFQDSTKETLPEVIPQSSFKNKIEIVESNRTIFEADTFRDFFSPSLNPLVSKLKELFAKKEMKKADTIVMVGGFSESSVVKGTLKKYFGNKTFIIPDNPSLAIMKGAVIFGHFPCLMSARIAKLTYGFSYVRKAELGDPDSKIVDGECHTAFDKLVEIGPDVPVGNVTAERLYSKIRPDQREMVLMLYSSISKNPKYITDPECSFVGHLDVKLPSTFDEGVLVQIIYGDTELTVYATEQFSKERVTAKFNFLKD